MFKRRLMPVLFLKDSWMVRSETFSYHQYLGDPVVHVRRMVDWNVDELIVVDIGHGAIEFEHQRSDFRNKPVKSITDFIALIGVECHIPLTFGGRIRTLDDIHVRIRNGADKVTVNAALFDEPAMVRAAARIFGSQAIVASIDYRGSGDNSRVFTQHGSRDTGLNAVAAAQHAEALDVGEILLNSIDRDGMAEGYDIETIERVAQSVAIPVIACGGAGMNGHFQRCYEDTSASAVAAGNIFHFKENAYPNAKRFLASRRDDVRNTEINS